MNLLPRTLTGFGISLTFIAALALPAHASSAQSLLSRAVKDTNSVRTLVYTTKSVESGKNLSLTITMQGAEDEVANRERDRETVTAVARAPQGGKRTLHYTLDIIFMGGKTYYRNSLQQKNAWQTRVGMKFADTITGVTWQRGRTTVGDWTHPMKLVGALTSNGAEYKGRTSKATQQLPLQVWVSGGAHPYVTREVITADKMVQGQRLHYVEQQVFGPFDQPISIAQPATGST
jgi:hypothetical protein